MFNEIKRLDRIHFKARIPFRITDHNYGDHVANNVIVEYLHEGRVQFLNSLGYSEKDLVGVSLILSELHVKYVKQAFYPNSLTLEISADNFRPTRFDLLYRGFEDTGDLLLLAKSEMAAFDPDSGKPIRMPDAMKEQFSR